MVNDFRRPFAYITTKSKFITSGATDNMISRAPWPAPANRYYILRKASVESNSISPGNVVLWDQDLSSATPASRGSGGGPLVTIPLTQGSFGASGFAGFGGISGVGASGAVAISNNIGLTNQVRIPFFAGITCQAPVNTNIQLEVEVV